ncbi:MAG TPA: DHHA2 domain-containing protein, partial [Methanoregula sp.]|nr:DHHA2 domain-containing protein [Methanoregula sp.]
AGALLCGILSDTLALKMSTTTHRDKKAVEYLSRVAETDPAELGAALLERGMDLSGVPLHDLLSRDTKVFELSNRKVVISQVMVPSFAWNRERSTAIQDGLAALQKSSGTDLAVALFTSVMENASDVYCAAEETLVIKVFGAALPLRFDGVMSRKKDFLPWLGARLRDVPAR